MDALCCLPGRSKNHLINLPSQLLPADSAPSHASAAEQEMQEHITSNAKGNAGINVRPGAGSAPLPSWLAMALEAAHKRP